MSRILCSHFIYPAEVIQVMLILILKIISVVTNIFWFISSCLGYMGYDFLIPAGFLSEGKYVASSSLLTISGAADVHQILDITDAKSMDNKMGGLTGKNFQ